MFVGIARIFILVGLIFSLSPSVQAADECSLVLLPEFSKWSDSDLLQQTWRAWKHVQSIPYAFTDLVHHGRHVIRGVPSSRNLVRTDLFTLSSLEIKKRVFRHYTTPKAARAILESKRLVAGSTAYVESPYYFSDLTGVFLTRADAPDLARIGLDEASSSEWVDVRLSPDTAVVQITPDIYYVPGSPPLFPWLVESVQAGKIRDPRYAEMGWSAMEVPVEIEASSITMENPLKEAAYAAMKALVDANPALGEHFKADAGVPEGYTVEEHTAWVMEYFERTGRGFLSERMRARFENDARFRRLFEMTLLLHDIGKPLAIAAGDKNLQHRYTLPILKDELLRHGFSEYEIKLSQSLVKYDAPAAVLHHGRPLWKVADEVRAEAFSLGMSAGDLWSLHLAFYASDISAYPWLRMKLLTKEKEFASPSIESMSRMLAD